MHGGAIMAFADALGAIGAFMNLPEGAKGTTTIESKTNFLGAAPEGQTVTGETDACSDWQAAVSVADPHFSVRWQGGSARHPDPTGIVKESMPADFEIVPYDPIQRVQILDLSLRAWSPVFEKLEPKVPAYVYKAFYPKGWQARQMADVARIIR